MAESSDTDQVDDPHATKLFTVPVKDSQWPIVYGPEYNIGFLGLEKLHPFDAGKWGKVYSFLKDAGLLRDETTVRPQEASEQDLLVVHTRRYLQSLKLTSIVEGTVLKEWSVTVAGITEVPPVACLPNFIVQRKVLRPFRYQTGGTILAAKLAVERGWGINIGGGFHHCSGDRGGGFCAYADITLAIKFLFHRNPSIRKAMIVDLDAHQGNGHERDFMDDTSVYIMDVYNRGIYPHDGYAKRAIKKKVELQHYTGDQSYLNLVRRHLDESLNEFQPDILVYNAGTDILEGDPLGCLSISPQGIIERDQIVFQKARTRDIPVLMVTSGGYQRTTARIIADSILNLRTLGLISCDEAETAPRSSSEENSQSIPRSKSDGGLFARLKRSCLPQCPSSNDVQPEASSQGKSDQLLDQSVRQGLSKSASELTHTDKPLFAVEVDIEDHSDSANTVENVALKLAEVCETHSAGPKQDLEYKLEMAAEKSQSKTIPCVDQNIPPEEMAKTSKGGYPADIPKGNNCDPVKSTDRTSEEADVLLSELKLETESSERRNDSEEEWTDFTEYTAGANCADNG